MVKFTLGTDRNLHTEEWRKDDPHTPGQRAPWGSNNGRNICRCVVTHRPTPLEVEIHHLVPVGRPYFGPDRDINKVPLCCQTHSNVHFILRIFEKHGGKPPREAFKGIRVTPMLRSLVAFALDKMSWSWPGDETERL